MGLEPDKEIQDLRSASTLGAEMSNRLGTGLYDSKGLRRQMGWESQHGGQRRKPLDFGVWK